MQLLNNKKAWHNLLLYFVGYILVLPIVVTIVLSIFIPNVSFSLVLFIVEILLLILYWIANKNFLLAEIKDFNQNIKQNFVTITSWFAWIYILNFVSSVLISFLGTDSISNNQAGIEASIQENLGFTLFSIIIIAPIVEEIVFRLSIFSLCIKKSKTLAVVIASVLFGFLHIAGSLFAGDFQDLIHILPYVSIGFCLCQCYLKTNNFIAVIILHAINNIVAALAIVLSL